jgi:endonuclease/exonuclease/phosphatase (EEP) superfamily protein YafD
VLRHIAHRIGRRAVWIVFALSLAGFVAGALGRYSPELDVIANARSHLAAIAAFCVLALWLDYRPVLVLAFGTFLTLAGHSILAQESQWPLIGTARAEIPAKGWKIVTLNTWHHHPDPDGLAGYLSVSDADILVLEEFGPNKLNLLHGLDAYFPYRKDCADDWDCSIAILSKHPFDASGAVARGADGGPPRAWIRFGTGADALTIFGTHVCDPLRSTRLHSLEIAQLGHIVREIQGEVIVAGDFNATPWTHGFRTFETLSGLRHMGRFLPSFPSDVKGLPQLAIDHVFVSDGIAVDDAWLGLDAGSDHRPVAVRVALNSAMTAAK